MSGQIKSKRLISLDALRGFDMIWLLGAEGIFAALYTINQQPVFEVLANQFTHAKWHGFTAYDLIFPLFIFLSGVTLGISKVSLKQLSPAQVKSRYIKAAKRVFILCLLGILYNHGWGAGIPSQLEEIRVASVLMRIAIAWFFCALIVWNLNANQQLFAFVMLLLLYWIIQQFVPTPDGHVGVLNDTQSWNAWIDSNFLIGATYQNKILDPEGVFSQIPAIANALAGALIGGLISNNNKSQIVALNKILFIGAICIAGSYVWSLILPYNKTLWTSSFALLTIGLSCVLFGIFYWLFDLIQINKLAYFFTVIGVNSILLYLMTSIFNWQYLVDSLFGQLLLELEAGYKALLAVILLVLAQWLFANWLYRKRIFINV